MEDCFRSSLLSCIFSGFTAGTPNSRAYCSWTILRLPCLTLPVRWGSKMNQYVKVLFYCAGGGIEPPFAKTEPATDYREGGLFGTPFRCYRPSCIFFATSRQCRRAYIEPSGLFLRGSNIHLRPIGSVYSLKC